MKVSIYIKNNLIAIDQLLNSMIGGHPDETISSRSYRMSKSSRKWRIAEKLINGIFFWDKAVTPNGDIYRHCQLSMLMEIRMGDYRNKRVYKADVYHEVIANLENKYFKPLG